MIAPTPIDEPNLDSWGLIFSLKADEIFWFEKPGHMLGFLFLGSEKYLRGCTYEEKHALSESLGRAWEDVFLAVKRDHHINTAHFERADQLLGGSASLLWWGRFRSLIESEEPFPKQVRSLFKGCTGLTRPRKPGPQGDPDLYWVESHSYFERLAEWLEELDGHEEAACIQAEASKAKLQRRFQPPREGYSNEGGVWRC